MNLKIKLKGSANRIVINQTKLMKPKMERMKRTKLRIKKMKTRRHLLLKK